MSTIKVKRRYPVHSVFVIYTFVTVLVAIGAFNANNNLLYWLFGLSLGLLLVSGVVSGTMMMSLRVAREPIETGADGVPFRVRYTVENRSRFLPVMGLSIIETVDGLERAGEQLAMLDGPLRAEVLHVPPRSTVVVDAVAKPISRGMLRVIGFDAMTTFPFGIIKKTLWHDAPTSTIIQPGHADVDASSLVARGGVSASMQPGTVVGREGEEMVGVREYASGDPLKLVAWKASARLATGGLVVKQSSSGVPKRLLVRLTLMREDSSEQVERAIRVAAAWLRVGAAKRMRLGLSVSGSWAQGLDLAPGAQGGRSAALLNELALLARSEQAGNQEMDRPALGRAAVADVVVDVDATSSRVLGAHAPSRDGVAGTATPAAAEAVP